VLNDVWKKRLKHWSKELALMAVLVFVLSNVMSYLRAPTLKDKSLPLISTVLTTKEHFTTADFESEPVLIHFWATWCPTCKLEAANIQDISQNYHVITIAVKSGNDAKINVYMKENNLNFKVINDEEGILSQDFSVQGYPTSFIYNKEGKLSFSEIGYTSTLGLRARMWWAGL